MAAFPASGSSATGATGNAAFSQQPAVTAFGAPTLNAAAGYGGYVAQPQTNLRNTNTAANAVIPSTAAAVNSPYGPAGGIQKPIGTNIAASRGGLGVYAGNAGVSGLLSTGRASNVAVSAAAGTGLDADYNDGDYSAIPGVPGVDYPIYAVVPQTTFDCSQQPLPGYYADVEANCQVFHICALNRTFSFLCPNGTIFSQEVLVCVWWNQYECASSLALYANNAYIYDYGNRIQEDNVGNRQLNQFGARTNTNNANTNSIFAGNAAATTNAIRPTAQSFQAAVSPAVYGNNPSTLNRFATLPTAVTNLARPSAASVQSYSSAAALLANPNTNTAATLLADSQRQVVSATPLPTAQVATTPTNREYLPPTGRRTKK